MHHGRRLPDPKRHDPVRPGLHRVLGLVDQTHRLDLELYDDLRLTHPVAGNRHLGPQERYPGRGRHRVHFLHLDPSLAKLVELLNPVGSGGPHVRVAVRDFIHSGHGTDPQATRSAGRHHDEFRGRQFPSVDQRVLLLDP